MKRNLLAQALGHEPESLWMAMLGLICALAFTVIPVLIAVAMGAKP